jgi:hypothetical protein
MKIYNRKKKEGVELKVFWKEFKEGLQKVTPYQQCITTQLGHIITGIGIIWGIIFSFRIGYWWMGVILIGGMIVLSVQYLGNWQKKMILKKMDELIKIAEMNTEQFNQDNLKVEEVIC